MPHRWFGREELAAGLRAAEVGLWAWDLETLAVRFSAELEVLLELPVGSFAGTIEAALAEVHEEDRERVRAEVERTLADGRDEFEVECRRRPRSHDARLRWICSRGRVVKHRTPTMFGAVMDITERKEAERAALEAAERYRLLAQLTSDYVYDVSPADAAPGIVAGSFERITGYTPDEIEALGGWPTIVHPDDRPRSLELALSSKVPRRYLYEYRIVAKDGSIRWLRDRGQPLIDPETGSPVRFRGGVQDITELKELEQRLLQAQRMEAFAELSGRVAHDFNNLLTIVLGALGLIARKASALPPEVGTYLEAAEEALDRATELTRSLLTFGRHEVASAEVVDLRRELEAGMPLLTSAAGDSVSVHAVIDPALAGPARVLVDPGQLRLALMNLVLNARDAAGEGSEVEIRLAAGEGEGDRADRPADLPPGPYATLEVADRGPGIPPELLGRVFEPYFTTKPGGRGSGLGLAIAYGVAHKHGGTISVTSELGVGTRFTLWFPLSDEPLATRAEPKPRVAPRGLDRLLVVEDDDGVRAMVVHVLESHGYEVSALSSAEEALALTDQELCAHDLLLSDVRLGGMDGVALAAEIVARCPGLAVVLVSGYAEEAQRDGIDAHGFRFVPKPFTPTALVAAIHETLRAHHG